MIHFVIRQLPKTLIIGLLSTVLGCTVVAQGETASQEELEEMMGDPDESPSFEEVSLGCLNGDPKFCFELGILHDFGEGIDEDNQKAMILYQAACDEDFAPACLEIAAKHRLADEVDYSSAIAIQLYEKACGLQDATGCYFWGGMVQDGEHDNFPDEVKAAELYSKACELELAYACFESAMVRLGDADLEPNTHTPKAVKIFYLLTQGCALGDGDSCYSLSGTYTVGYGTNADLELATKHEAEAREYWTIACEQGDETACEYLEE